MTSGLALLALFLKVLLFVVVLLFFSTTQFVTAVPRVRLRHGERIDVLAKQTMDLKYVLVDEEYEERFLNETMQRDGNESDTDDKELHSQTRIAFEIWNEKRVIAEERFANEKSIFFECCCFWCAAMEKKDKS